MYGNDGLDASDLISESRMPVCNEIWKIDCKKPNVSIDMGLLIIPPFHELPVGLALYKQYNGPVNHMGCRGSSVKIS